MAMEELPHRYRGKDKSPHYTIQVAKVSDFFLLIGTLQFRVLIIKSQSKSTKN